MRILLYLNCLLLSSAVEFRPGQDRGIDVVVLACIIGGRMEEMNQRTALGISLKAFAVLMIVVCFIYEVVTPSVSSGTLWFSYLVGAILCAVAYPLIL